MVSQGHNLLNPTIPYMFLIVYLVTFDNTGFILIRRCCIADCILSEMEHEENLFIINGDKMYFSLLVLIPYGQSLFQNHVGTNKTDCVVLISFEIYRGMLKSKLQ